MSWHVCYFYLPSDNDARVPSCFIVVTDPADPIKKQTKGQRKAQVPCYRFDCRLS